MGVVVLKGKKEKVRKANRTSLVKVKKLSGTRWKASMSVLAKGYQVLHLCQACSGVRYNNLGKSIKTQVAKKRRECENQGLSVITGGN